MVRRARDHGARRVIVGEASANRDQTRFEMGRTGVLDPVRVRAPRLQYSGARGDGAGLATLPRGDRPAAAGVRPEGVCVLPEDAWL